MTGTHKPVLHLFDQSKKDDSKNNYHLSLQIGIDGFCFALFHLKEETYIGIADYVVPNNSEQTLASFFIEVAAEDKWLQGTFKSVSVSFTSSKNTLIPTALFEEEHIKSYLSINTGNKHIENPLYNRLLETDIINCFSVDKDIYNVITKQYPGASILHQGSIQIEAAGHRKLKDPSIFLQFNRKSIDIVSVKGKQIQLMNSFNYTTSEDVIYYLLYVMEQLSFDQNTTTVVLMGNIQKESKVYELLYTYINLLTMAEWPSGVKYAHPIKGLAPHQFHLLIQQYLCA
jgi:hypothetical protein